jgi:quinoprotein glucose dehydrogenase
MHPHTSWRLQDTNDDGRAELKEKLLTGFGVRFAYRGHDMHGLRFGPDGQLYFSIGGSRDERNDSRGLASRLKRKRDRSSRCNPDGTNFEIFATGLRNPQELVFDDHGNLWTLRNDSDAGDASRLPVSCGGAIAWRRGCLSVSSDRGPWMRERPWDEKDWAGDSLYSSRVC